LPEPPGTPKIAIVDHSLLRSWLGLPPGPWPPDHYALLGLATGAVDPVGVERTVLERMGRLRSHQLLHPELVTEGMNRLAQALVCLTDPIAKPAYDAELGLSSSLPVAAAVADPQPRPPPLPDASLAPIPGFPIPTEEEPVSLDETQVIEVRFMPGLAPPALESAPPYEVVEDGPHRPAPPSFEVVPDDAVDTTFAVSQRTEWQPATRRRLYSRIADLRRVRAAWSRLEPFFSDPREPLDRPIRVLMFLEGVIELRESLGLLPDLLGDLRRSGGRVAALVRQPLVLAAVRVLLPDQRRALALDWRTADAELEVEYNRLRELSRSGRKRRRPFRRRGRLMKAARWCIRNPEVLLVGLGVAVVVAAMIRVSFGR
jgi:hypothetical protein